MRKPLKSFCAKVKLKSGSIERAREWAGELNSRKEEVIATLIDEGVYIESAFLDQSEHADFLIYYMRVESMEKAQQVVKQSLHPVDAYHKQFKIDCWESKKQLELLIDFDRTNERPA